MRAPDSLGREESHDEHRGTTRSEPRAEGWGRWGRPRNYTQGTYRRITVPPPPKPETLEPEPDLIDYGADEFLTPAAPDSVQAWIREQERLRIRSVEPEEGEESEPEAIPTPWTPAPQDVIEHTRHLREYPWICYYAGVGPCPIPEPEPIVKPEREERDAWTLTSCRKARERARDRGQAIHPPWAISLDLMYREVVDLIGVCPPDTRNGQRIMTLHRIKNKLGYVPGNIKWADKSEQRDEQDRMR